MKQTKSSARYGRTAIASLLMLCGVPCGSVTALGQDLAPEPEPAVEPTEPPTPPQEQPEKVRPLVNKPGVTHFGKISVLGSIQNIRGSIASMAESMRVELNKLCGEANREMKLPLIIHLHGVEGDAEQPRAVVSKIEQLQGQYQLNIHVHLAKGVNRELLRYHLMEMLLYERGLGAGQEVVDGERVLVKPWLIVGMLEAINIKAGRHDKRIYQADVNYLEILPLQKVFVTTEKQWRSLIGRKPMAYRAVSGAMVNSLLRQPDGRPAMTAYLADVATFKGEHENLLRKHFPGMNKSRNSLGKWVNLELLELSTARMTQVFSILETEQRLDEILKLRYRDKQGSALSVGIDGYADVLKLKPVERVEAVTGVRAELERLSYRCFPTYRPLLNEYEMILREIIVGKDKDIRSRLTKLMDIRLKMQDAGKRVRDYLDWYYITQSNNLSGDFKKYRDIVDALDKEKLRPPADDSTQRYLDQVEKLFSRGVGGSK